MKVLAVIALLATVAYASEDTAPANAQSEAAEPVIAEADVAFTANPAEFVGQLQETPNGPIIEFGGFPGNAAGGPVALGLLAIPSCILGPRIGNPICFVKCVSLGHAGGYCNGRICTCTN